MAAAVGPCRGFIEALPGGYDSPVAERGATLSVGQKQLLSFARALAFDPRILVLDEATSSVDTETELLIRDALHTLMAGRTTIAIAHRLSTIQDMDKILVLHRGSCASPAPTRSCWRSAGSTTSCSSCSTGRMTSVTASELATWSWPLGSWPLGSWPSWALELSSVSPYC